tara:strand:+ start:67 stop:651 length:585 start_codon:yes stop_codon:yes gene_type:complete
MSKTTLNLGSFGLADGNADKILFFDDSAGAIGQLAASTNLTISGTNVTASGGKILNVGHAVSTSEVTNNSTSSYADGNLSLAFTPTASDSTVLLILQLSIFLNHTTSADSAVRVKIFRDTTEIYDSNSTQNYHSASGSGNGNVRFSTPLIYKDSPSTTSQVTYSFDFLNPHSTQVIEISDNSAPSTLTAFEIGA